MEGAGRAPALPSAELVADVRTVLQTDYSPWADGVEFLEFDGALLFRGWDGIHGWELWRTDGTPEGTWMVRDICAGKCSSLPTELRILFGTVYFSAADADHGMELWRTDGTASGTELVVDIAPGGGSSNPYSFVEFDGSLFFAADDNIHGSEPWRSDGTPVRTWMIKDIWPGVWGSRASSFVALGEALFFAAQDPQNWGELWKTDGTAQGTHLVRDLCGGPESALPQEWPVVPYGSHRLRVVGERLIVAAYNGACPGRVWVSDGTPEGTQPLLSLEIGWLLPFAGADGALLFGATPDGVLPRTLWRTDGTPEGTWEVAPIEEPRGIGWIPPDVYLSAGDRDHGQELWRTDGTAAGTLFVEDLEPGSSSGLEGIYELGVSDARRLLFYAENGVAGFEPWITDGTAHGTRLLRDIYPGEADSIDPDLVPTWGAAINGWFVFAALDPATGFELWRSDGTPTGTELLADLDVQASGLAPWSYGRFAYLPRLEEIAATPEGVVFAADDGLQGLEPWFSDGTAMGTHLIADLCEANCDGATSSPRWLTPLLDDVFLFANDGDSPDPNLWRTDGTEQGTLLVHAENEGQAMVAWDGSPPRLLVDGRLTEWVSDGTTAGTILIAEGFTSGGAPAGAQAFFANSDDDAGTELWVTSGTAETTSRVADIYPGTSDSGPDVLASPGSWVAFSANDGTSGREPWASDGTEAGTVQLADISPGSDDSVRDDYLKWSLPVAGFVYFAANDGSVGEELWRTDGLGAERVADLAPGPVGSDPRGLAVWGTRLLFSAYDPTHGRELWQTDAATGETLLVSDLNPGSRSGIVDAALGFYSLQFTERPIVWNDRLYFAGDDGETGLELWSTDGTAGGTVQVADIHPGPGSSSPGGFASLPERLFFAATDGSTGFELWAVGESPLVFEDGFESGDTSAWSQTVP